MTSVIYSPDAPTSAIPTMPIDDTADPFAQFREALENESPESLGVSEATYFRWKAGDLPLFARAILPHPHLVKALHRDSVDYSRNPDADE